MKITNRKNEQTLTCEYSFYDYINSDSVVTIVAKALLSGDSGEEEQLTV